MSEIKNGGLDQYGSKPFEQQQFGTAGVEWVKRDQLDFRRTIIFTYLLTIINHFCYYCQLVVSVSDLYCFGPAAGYVRRLLNAGRNSVPKRNETFTPPRSRQTQQRAERL